MQVSRPQIHKWIYFFSLSVIAVGMPLSEFLMSIGQIIMAANWFIEGNVIEKFKQFWKNKTAVLISSLLLLHALGLIYTSDFEYALNDLRIKAPILILAVLISTSEPLTKQVFDWLMAIFVASVVTGTFISMGVYDGIVPVKTPVTDMRDISIFISHIRFSLLICISIFIIVGYFFNEPQHLRKFLFVIAVIWLVVFLTILDSLTGVVVLVAAACVLLLRTFLISNKNWQKLLALTIVSTIIAGTVFYLKPLIKTDGAIQQVDYWKLEKKTANGNPYTYYELNKDTENGYLLWIYVCWPEVERAWDARSSIKISEKNKRGDDIKFTLIRYLSSKGWRKDSLAVASLSDYEIKQIENGIANINYVGKSKITMRIMETLWELQDYKMGRDMNGHSVAQRIEFWKAGWHIFKKHPLIGVGTGDIKNEYASAYNEIKSPLDTEHRLRSHNQYLSIAVAFGTLGFIWFIIVLMYPFVRYRLWNNYLYFTFFLIAILSFLNEDTLETQPGLTFFAFFNALLLFGVKKEIVTQ
ncbi:MAG: O-antigen ligase family protein [Bacteroidia bacterium]|nr:O-antigen ligase family protein [Bacteroidia bacterium]